MNTFISAALLIIMINQFLIKVSINELEEKVDKARETQRKSYKWFSDTLNYIWGMKKWN